MPDIGRKRGAILVLKTPVINALDQSSVTIADSPEWAAATAYVQDDVVTLDSAGNTTFALVCIQTHQSTASALTVSDTGELTGSDAPNWEVTAGRGAIFDIATANVTETRNTTDTTSLDKAGTTTTTVDSVTLSGTVTFNLDATNPFHKAMSAKNQFPFSFFPFGPVIGSQFYTGSLQFDTSADLGTTRVPQTLTWTAVGDYKDDNVATEANLRGL